MWRKNEQAHKARVARCSFCGKQQSQVERLIAGPRVFICSECVDLCQQIIQEGREGQQPASNLPNK